MRESRRVSHSPPGPGYENGPDVGLPCQALGVIWKEVIEAPDASGQRKTVSGLFPVPSWLAKNISLTTNSPEPRVTSVFMYTMSVRSPRGVSVPFTVSVPLETGRLSPVSADSSISSVASGLRLPTTRLSIPSWSPARSATRANHSDPVRRSHLPGGKPGERPPRPQSKGDSP
jgi:hypothetical protein